MNTNIEKIKSKFLNLSKLLKIMILMFFCTTLYVFFISESFYISKTKIIIKQEKEVSSSQIEKFLSTRTDSSYQDALLLKEYILSNEMLQKLDLKFKLKDKYRATFKTNSLLNLKYKTLKKDPFSILWFSEQERFLKFYRSRIKINIDEMSSITSIEFRDEDPELSKAILEEIIKNSELFINKISTDLAVNKLKFIEIEKVKLKTDLENAEQELREFQNRNKIVDPQIDVKTSSEIIGALEAELISKEIELKKTKAYLSENSFQVKSLRKVINGIYGKISAEKAKLTNTTGVQLNDLAIQHQNIIMKVEIFKELYKSALNIAQVSKAESIRQIKFLVIIDSPTLPESSEYPRRWYIMMISIIIFLLITGITRLIISFIREHKDF